MRIASMAIAITLVFMPLQAFAKVGTKLPAGAKPLSASEVTAIYSGKTSKWSHTKTFWAQDGTAVASYPDRAFATGTWKVSGNEFCYSLNWMGKDKADASTKKESCSKLYKDGKKVWVENTSGDDVGDIWNGVEKQQSKGDQVSKDVLAFKKKNGY